MGRVTTTQTPAAAPPPSTPLTHFSHPHDLHPTTLYNPQTLCSGCKLQSSGTMFACVPCTFILHQSCANLPQLITHPSHGGCTLTLLTAASYPGGIFSCDACARRGDGWSYHCTRCEYDLHVTCASKPLKMRHQGHVSCDLDLTFKNPYVNSTGFSCDICRKIGSKQWLYRCNTCEFDVHLDCTTVTPRQQLLQHHHSLPAGAQVNATVGIPLTQPHLMHSVSTGGINVNNNPHNNNQFQQMGHQGYGSSMVNPGNNYQRVNNNQGSLMGGIGSNLLMSAVSGLVEGAFQEIGQTAVQEIINTGGDGGGGEECV